MQSTIDAIKPRKSVDELYKVSDPNIAERVILDLAIVFHRRDNTGSSVVSHRAQVIAYSYFERCGLDECLRVLAEDMYR